MKKILTVIYVAVASSAALVACQRDSSTETMNAENMAAQVDTSSWPAAEEAVVAAPRNHEVLYEDDSIRFLSVSVSPGE